MARRQVMVVDDDADIRETLGDLLVDEGYEVESAAGGREALELLRNGARPGVILLDLMMPEMNGWQFRAAQLDDPALAGVPVVVVSALSDVAGRASALGVPYLAKPIDLDQLLSTVARYCGR
jgi:CheY-like chemotaxis protein